MKHRKLWLPFVAALFITALPSLAAAQPSAVYDTLAGSALDPSATTVRVVPPRGGTVMVYQRGKVVGWWMRAGVAAIQPNRPYSVLATRGSQLLFNRQVMMRPGSTEFIWADGNNAPLINYYPALGYRQPAQRVYVSRNNRASRRSPANARRSATRRARARNGRVGMQALRPRAAQNQTPRPRTLKTHATAEPRNTTRTTARKTSQRNAARVAPRRAISDQDYSRMLRAMDYADNDRARLTVLRSYARRFSFAKAQRAVIAGRFQNRTQRDNAMRLMD